MLYRRPANATSWARAREAVPSGTHHELCRAVHAEHSAIIQAALHGISIEGSTLYCTPRLHSLRQDDVSMQVKRVVYSQSYPDGTSLQFLEQAGIEVARI